MSAAVKAIALIALTASVARAQDANTYGAVLDAQARPQEATADGASGKPHSGTAKRKALRTSATADQSTSASSPAGRTEKVALVSSASPPRATGPQMPRGQARAPQSGTTAVGELEPVLHARNAKIGACMDNVLAQAGGTITAPHDAISTWVTASPNDNVFQSIVGINYPGKVAPNGAAILLAAPVNGKKCEGQSIQIIPSAQSCTAIEATIVRTSVGSTLATLRDLPLMQMKDGSRSLLMPSAGGGCVLVSVRLR